jgi:hypothetical protein
VKRSKSIRLVLLGSLSAGALTGCGPSKPVIDDTTVFTNNYYVPGVGYYHAPFRAWYALPYNHYDARDSRYYWGGQWGASPYQSVVNISSPTPEAVRQVAAQRTDVRRSGFGSRSHYYGIHS